MVLKFLHELWRRWRLYRLHRELRRMDAVIHRVAATMEPLDRQKVRNLMRQYYQRIGAATTGDEVVKISKQFGNDWNVLMDEIHGR